jgi:hypothetical protein
MTCDDAFELLTTSCGRSDARLIAHLAACPRCGAMADALAPAIDLFEETPTVMDNSTDAVAVARTAAARLARRADRVPARGWFSRRAGGLVLAGFAGAACCLLALQIGGRGDGKTEASCPRHSAASTEWMNRNSVPVAMACIACHPPAGGLAPVSGAAASGRGTL